MPTANKGIFMKLLFVLGILAFLPKFANADQCTNFNGSYRSDSSAAEKINVAQIGCQSLVLNFKNQPDGVQTFVLDGKKRKMLESDGIAWWASALFQSNGEEILIKNETTFPNGKSRTSLRRLRLDYTYAAPKIYLLDERGKLGMDGVFIARDSEAYIKE